MWEVLVTDEFRVWYEDLEQDDQEPIQAAMTVLEQRGPSLKRPLVGEILSSRHKNMKELIPPASDIRILFVFDPLRHASCCSEATRAGRGPTGIWRTCRALTIFTTSTSKNSRRRA